ncbi:MAG: GNAT family N-acetyltransferase [Tepidisphaeraceae bacterium]
MSVTLRWVGEDERDRVAQTRMLCYASARTELADYIDRLRKDVRSRPGDWLLAERGGEAVGTATSIPMTMWVRGGSVSCQGVAHVGTIKTQRRRSSAADASGVPGIATLVMNETLRAARERGFVVSALMPFRGSFYEHFGYGFVERQASWTIPMAAFAPGDSFDELRFYRPGDFDALVSFKQRLAERGHGDIERSAALWKQYAEKADSGHMIVERSGDGPIRGFAFFEQSHDKHLDTVNVVESLYEDIPALRRILAFLGSLRDQYSFATILLPADLRLNWLLGETQMTHRGNRNHATAEVRPFTRMQVRVLDHAKLLAGMKLPADRSGKVVVAIRECEGNVTKLAIETADGKASATPSDASADVEMTDRVWAAVVFGDLPATRAAEMGLVSVTSRAPLAVLDAFAAGPAPFCREYF